MVSTQIFQTLLNDLLLGHTLEAVDEGIGHIHAGTLFFM